MDTSLEERLKVVEAAIAELKQQSARPEPNWIDQITGSFKNDPIFDEVLAYGREFQYSDRPNDDVSTESRSTSWIPTI